MVSERWEYCCVIRHSDPVKLVYYGPEGERVQIVGDGRKSGNDAAKAFAELGVEGWELASVDDGSSYFKRRMA